MARTPQGNPRPAEKPRFTRSQSPRPPFRRAKGPVDERWIWGVHAVAAALGNPKRKLLRKLATETGDVSRVSTLSRHHRYLFVV
jgi:hypothetical protein